MLGAAVFDATRRLRYTLTREWGAEGKGGVLWVMLNPSTADEWQDDPTIRRCINFSRTWGYGRLVICNLFALRATDPRELYRQGGVVGVGNDAILRSEAARADLVVAAWGNHGRLFGRSTHVRELLVAATPGGRLHHLGLTTAGQPRHPLYLPSSCRPQPWRKSEWR